MISPKTQIGAEIEVAKLGREATAGLISWLKFDTHDDGSLREQTFSVGDIAVYPQIDEKGAPIVSLGMSQNQRAFGLEIVTNPYPYIDMIPIATKLAMYLRHIPQNPRTSIHLHVDADRMTWREAQSLLIWAHALEAVIYRIACAGQQHRGCRAYRGDLNDHKFARPLSAPIGSEWSNGMIAPLIAWDQIKNAKSASEFVAAWGRLDLYWGHGMEHYMPHRLHMINLAAILRTGTIEWRVFDGIYEFIPQFVQFVYAVHSLADKLQPPDFEFTLGTTPGVDARWVSNLLDMDVEPLWGSNWQAGCSRLNPMAHYPNRPVLATVDYKRIRPIQYDDGSDKAPLFIRG